VVNCAVHELGRSLQDLGDGREEGQS